MGGLGISFVVLLGGWVENSLGRACVGLGVWEFFCNGLGDQGGRLKYVHILKNKILGMSLSPSTARACIHAEPCASNLSPTISAS